MSIQVDCPSCAFGSHEKHDPAWGIIPGLIGGKSCGCPGDCPDRWKEQSMEFAAMWGFNEISEDVPVDWVIYFFHPVFGPWGVDATEEEVAQVVEEEPTTLMFYAAPGLDFWRKENHAQLG